MSRQGAANVAARSPSTPARAAVALPPAVAPSSAAFAPATPLAPLGHREAQALVGSLTPTSSLSAMRSAVNECELAVN
eukprot:5904186-Prymnesium_polylepis.1